MDIKAMAVAGTFESSDIYVKIEPCDKLEIEIESPVYRQFGDDILKSVREVAREMDVASGRITINDRGALDCVIRARVETAIRRAGGDGR